MFIRSWIANIIYARLATGHQLLVLAWNSKNPLTREKNSWKTTEEVLMANSKCISYSGDPMDIE